MSIFMHRSHRRSPGSALATYTGETRRALVTFTAGDDRTPREVLVPATVKAGDVTSAVYAQDHMWFEVCPGPTCRVIRLISEEEVGIEARVAGILLDAPTRLNDYPVIRWYEIRTAQGQIGVALVAWRSNSPLVDAWTTWVCYPVYRSSDATRIEWGCYAGHYDLTIEDAETDFFDRCRRIGR